MIVNILVQSDLSAPANGFIQVAIDSSLPVQNLITKFCEDKEIEVTPQYCLMDIHNHILDGNKSIAHCGIQSGDKVLFCSSSGKPKHSVVWNCLAISALIFSILGFVVCLAVYLGFISVPDSYAMVLDAGSTHTQVILYSWPGNKINKTGMVVQENSCNIKGGVADLSGASEVPGYLDTCLFKIRGSIPADSIDHTEVFFGATAGMRLLKEMNDTTAEEILTQIKKSIREMGLKFVESDAGILTGSEEGADGWLTVNYLNNNLLTKVDTWGALDLGGASTQISFQLNESQVLPTKNDSLLTSFQVYGREVKVFSKSFLCYGMIQAGIRYRAYLILQHQTLKEGRIVMSPCEHTGYSINTTAAAIFRSPCSPRSNNTQITEGIYTFVGTSNVNACQSTIRYILSEKFCEEYQLHECISLKDLPVGFQDSNFMAFSAFGYINKTLGLSANVTMEKYELEIRNGCAKNLYQLVNEYIQSETVPKISLVELTLACLKRVYMFTLLSEIYQFNTERTWSNLRFGIRIKDKDLGWALGFMVNETQHIAAAPPVHGMNTLAFVLLVILFSLFLLASIGFVIHAVKSRKAHSRPYRNLGVTA